MLPGPEVLNFKRAGRKSNTASRIMAMTGKRALHLALGIAASKAEALVEQN